MKPQRRSPSWLTSQASRTYLATFGLLGLCTLMGFAGISASRYIFMLGCLVVGYIAWRDTPGRHLEATIILFSFAPFVRRVIDVNVGFDMVGLMLSGPLLAMLIPCMDLKQMLMGRGIKDSGPFVLAIICIAYGTMISVFTGDYQVDMAQTLKWLTPVLYGLWVMEKSRDQYNDMIGAASRAFLIVAPIMGIYGVMQYLDPMSWDRYWMLYGGMTSIGLPEPFQVRVFSTMNSPASFATFAVIGLLVFCFTRKGWQAALIGITIALALMLSQYRTAWISLGAGLAYGLVFPKTRIKSTAIIVVGIAVVLLAVTSGGPIGDVLSERFNSMQQGANDGSAVERLSEFTDLYAMSDNYLVGKGFSALVGDIPGLVAVDGTVIACYLVMGMLVGTLCLLALIWACVRGLSRITVNDSPMRIATGAVVLGMLISIPLQGVTSGEFGFLFWTFIGIATARPTYNYGTILEGMAVENIPTISFAR